LVAGECEKMVAEGRSSKGKASNSSKAAVRHLKVRLGASAFVRTLAAKPCTDESLGEKRELAVFLQGVPREATRKDLESCLSAFGAVESAALHPSSKSAIVVFSRKKDADSLLKGKKAETKLLPSSAVSKANQGAYRLLKEYRKKRPGNKVLLERANAWIEAKEAEEEALRLAREQAAVDDGWTVVSSRKGRHKNRDAEGTNTKAVARAAAEARRKDAAHHKDFYHFQQREARRNEILELQDKFKQDKLRIAELRAKRKFNPYDM